MPLHDWATTRGWSELHTYWLTELARHIKPQLPPGYRARIETEAALTPDVEPDVGVFRHTDATDTGTTAVIPEPDFSVAVAEIRQPELHVAITFNGRLVSAVELVSPRNKDRVADRRTYGAKYAGYLRDRVQLLIVDVHPRYRDFSFADFIAAELRLTDQPPLPVPFAASYRVVPAVKAGEPCLLEAWRRPLTVGDPLPEIPLALDGDRAILIDLDGTYSRAAAESYLA